MIHDTLQNWQQYFHTAPWRTAFEFLLGLSATTPDADRINLHMENMYAAVMSYQTCLPDDSVLETHDAHVDIQVSLNHSETIDWYTRDALSVVSPYDAALDRTFYACPGSAPVRIANHPGRFSVFFPNDAHMPKLITDNASQLVKKVVVKLPVRLLHG
ncbi:YhcH/YjgK/YiaL family protein [Desulfonatronum parangueonense]